eukprot:TRINITY_DN759_c0_g1_i2.p2 TRINITY_DN759_c0_g1~~TRINITY_DN759_c0_g1_i2.p2  ORF type:complete len:150 (+),score=18.68 TRINITY_DN759_c0_g1_i2:1359-1808(+)
MYSPDSSIAVVDEEQPLVHHSNPPAPEHIRPFDHEDVDVERPDPIKEAILRALFSPPFIAVVSAMTCALIAPVGDAFLHDDGALRPLFLSINIVGGVVVPISCMIVGAELYRSLAKVSVLHNFSPFFLFCFPQLTDNFDTSCRLESVIH